MVRACRLQGLIEHFFQALHSWHFSRGKKLRYPGTGNYAGRLNESASTLRVKGGPISKMNGANKLRHISGRKRGDLSLCPQQRMLRQRGPHVQDDE